MQPLIAAYLNSLYHHLATTTDEVHLFFRALVPIIILILILLPFYCYDHIHSKYVSIFQAKGAQGDSFEWHKVTDWMTCIYVELDKMTGDFALCIHPVPWCLTAVCVFLLLFAVLVHAYLIFSSHWCFVQPSTCHMPKRKEKKSTTKWSSFAFHFPCNNIFGYTVFFFVWLSIVLAEFGFGRALCDAIDNSACSCFGCCLCFVFCILFDMSSVNVNLSSVKCMTKHNI